MVDIRSLYCAFIGYIELHSSATEFGRSVELSYMHVGSWLHIIYHNLDHVGIYEKKFIGQTIAIMYNQGWIQSGGSKYRGGSLKQGIWAAQFPRSYS